ncbi:MAG TPA: (Fe-S)-binding protein [Bacteroidales bacterium]|nr:(Fe-S)-binding protein [Bacteroidales bacterium]
MKETRTASQQKALGLFTEKLNGRLISHLNSCVHCGLCGESCQYFLATGDPRFIPGRKVDLISSIYRRYHTVTGRLIPKLTDARDLDEETIREMVDVIFGACTMCGRCSAHCSIGIDIPLLVRSARTMLSEMGLVPGGLQSTVDAAIRTGNNMAIPRNEFVDTILWLEEDLKMEVNDESAAIPLDQPGKRIMYTLNPREPKFFPLSISAMAKVFYAAGEDWTLSSNHYDVTNYAFYSGEDQLAAELTERMVAEMETLGAKMMVLAECGHGSRSHRWEGPEWIERSYPFEVKTAVELLAEYIRSGRIKVDPSKNKLPVTLHDPCNLVRLGGVIEEQRYILKHTVSNFIEMTPNRTNNYCCGGGGGQLSMSEYNDRRLKIGKLKADQIQRTGARIVATPCHNCIDQIMGLNQHYGLGVEVKTLGEIVADALVL